MNTKSVPSLYRYCMSRLSTFAVSTFRPALNVRSTTLPDRTFFSLVRTNAPPLPGLTCWNSMTVHSWPSILSTVPFFRSLVVATIVASCRVRFCAVRRSAHSEHRIDGRRPPTIVPCGRNAGVRPASSSDPSGDCRQREAVRIGTETRHRPRGDRPDHGDVPEALARVGVGQVHL